MAEPPVITPEMRAAVGVESEPRTWDVERGAVEKFALAVGDTSTLYTDPREARHTPVGAQIAPPTFLRLLKPGPHRAVYDQPLPNVLDGGSEYTFYEPIRVGDTIVVTSALAEVYERSGRLGPMLFRVHEIRYVNQFGELAATQRTTSINYRAEG